MSLIVNLSVGTKTIGELHVHSYHNYEPPERVPYVYEYFQDGSKDEPLTGKIHHDYNAGAVVLVCSVLAQLIAGHSGICQGRSATRNRARCGSCGDELESLYVHDFRQCRCGKTFIDGGQGGYYARRGGNAKPASADTLVERKLKQLRQYGPVSLTVVGDTDSTDFLLSFTLKDGEHIALRDSSLTLMLDEAIKRLQRDG